MRTFPCPRQQGVWLLVVLLLAATLVWLLSSTNIIQGNWAPMLNATFTGLGTIFTVLQWHAQANSDTAEPTKPSSPDQAGLHNPLIQGAMSRRKGAVVVYTSRSWRGTPIRLLASLHETPVSTAPIEAISTVVEDRRTGRPMFLCFFPMVPPGNYTLVAPIKQRSTHITVRSGLPSVIDWR